MVLFGDLNFGEQTAIQFQSRCQMVQSLFEIPVSKIGVSKFCVGLHQHKQIFFMNVHKKFTESKLLNSYSDHTLDVLRHSILVHSFVALDQLTTDFIVDLVVVLVRLLLVPSHILLVHLLSLLLILIFFLIIFQFLFRTLLLIVLFVIHLYSNFKY